MLRFYVGDKGSESQTKRPVRENCQDYQFEVSSNSIHVGHTLSVTKQQNRDGSKEYSLTCSCGQCLQGIANATWLPNGGYSYGNSELLQLLKAV